MRDRACSSHPETYLRGIGGKGSGGLLPPRFSSRPTESVPVRGEQRRPEIDWFGWSDQGEISNRRRHKSLGDFLSRAPMARSCASPYGIRVGAVIPVWIAKRSYASRLGSPFSSRGLPPDYASLPYESYEVMQPVTVQSGLAALSFDLPGLGVQFKLPTSVQELIDAGVLRKR